MRMIEQIGIDWEKSIKPLIPEVETTSLYHYTNTAGLMGMIKNNEIWITERNFMNDIGDKSSADNFFEEIGLDSPSSFESYIFSLSTYKNKSNQWSTYGKNDGYCIEFNKNDLLSYLNDGLEARYFSIFGRVIYDDKKKLQIKEALKKLINKYGKRSTPDITFRSIPLHSLLKDSSWEFEGEVRYVVHKMLDFHSLEVDFTMEESFREKNGLITPYISLSRLDPSKKNNDAFHKYMKHQMTYDEIKKIHSNKKRKLPISKIYIGPKVHDPIAKNGLDLFLKHHGYKDVKIEFSKGKHR